MSTETKNKKESAILIESPKPSLFSRQPSSVFGKIAFWAAIVDTLAGIGGAVTLTITSGAPSKDIVIGLVCSLTIVILLATRMRWTPLVTMLLGVFSFYWTITEPYALASLSDPKGPDGGFGKFVGIVVILGCILLIIGGSIGAMVENYRNRGDQTSRWLPGGLSLVAGLVIGAIFIGALSQPPVPVGTTYTNGVPTIHMNATNFDQPSVTISKGSKLMLVDDTSVVHILANGSWQNGTAQKVQEAGAPPVNNLQLNGNSIEIGPFNTIGTYHIYCEVHQGMNLTIIIQ